MKVFLIVRDLYTWPASMLDVLAGWHDAQPVVIDMASTSPACLRWLANDCPCPVLRAHANLGYRGPWEGGFINEYAGPDFYAVTDPDLDLADVPPDALLVMRDALDREPGLCKVGLSLEVDDVPGDFPHRDQVLRQQAAYWPPPVRGLHMAPVDTTLAVYDRRRPYQAGQINYAGRLPRPYTARHLPWYVAPHRYSDEYRYYLDHVERLTDWSRQMRDAA